MQDDGDGLVRGGDPPPAIAPAIAHVAWLPVGAFGQALRVWAETRSEEENLKLRHDLAEHVWADKATLVEPYCYLESDKGFFFSPLGLFLLICASS